MIQQTEFVLRPRARGFHLITGEVTAHLPNLPRVGLVNLFNNLVKERESWYDHTLEGWDDMPAHAKSTIVGASLTIPITDGRFNLGTWQGIYLCEFRNHGGGRHIVATVIGE